MTEPTNLDELLNASNRHEAEETLDDLPVAEAAPAEAVVEQAQKVETPAVDEDDASKKGLEPWMHARLKAKDERLSQREAELEQTKQELQRMQAMLQSQNAPSVPAADPVPQMLGTLEQQQVQMRLAVSHRLARQEFGAEEVDRALAWARDKAESDPNFRTAAWQHTEPAYFAVEEFRKQQAQQELAAYGYDLNKLMAAKMAQSQPSAGMVEAGPQSGERNKSSQQRAMPTDLQSVGTGGARGHGYSGPTPLSVLLKS